MIASCLDSQPYLWESKEELEINRNYFTLQTKLKKTTRPNRLFSPMLPDNAEQEILQMKKAFHRPARRTMIAIKCYAFFITVIYIRVTLKLGTELQKLEKQYNFDFKSCRRTYFNKK